MAKKIMGKSPKRSTKRDRLSPCPKMPILSDKKRRKRGWEGMLNMPQIDSIKNAYANGSYISEIARDLGYDRKTVRKYLEAQDFTEKMPLKKERVSILDPYKALINRWLSDDRNSWHKQRHTAKRIYDRLLQETDYQGSYPTVQRYVKAWRRKHHEGTTFLELHWYPGQAQADFGQADFLVSGKLERLHYLTLSFPYSNQAYVQVFRGETAECACQGLLDIFYHIGAIPLVIVFDNAAGVGVRIENVMREADLFRRFRLHHGFKIRFCNPNSGHEKGHVENKVGYIRRNLFVPVRELEDLVSFNRELLHECESQGQDRHYKKSKLVLELFDEDRDAMRELPAARFDVVRYDTRQADNYGKICLDGKHYYSSCPELRQEEILVGIRAHMVELFDTNGRSVASHERRFGNQRTDSTDHYTTLLQLVRAPNAWRNSGLREHMPSSVRDRLDDLDAVELKRALRVLLQLSERYSKEISLQALLRSLDEGNGGYATASLYAAQILDSGIEGGRESSSRIDLGVYDRFFLSRKAGA